MKKRGGDRRSKDFKASPGASIEKRSGQLGDSHEAVACSKADQLLRLGVIDETDLAGFASNRPLTLAPNAAKQFPGTRGHPKS